MRCSNSSKSTKRTGMSKRRSASCTQAPSFRASIQCRLGCRPHDAFVIEQPDQLVERPGIHRLRNIEVTARPQHAGHLPKGDRHRRLRHVMQRLEHQRQIEACVGLGNRLSAGRDEAQPLHGPCEVLRVLPFVDFQRGDAAVGVTRQQGAGQLRAAAAELDDALAGQWHQRSQQLQLVVDQQCRLRGGVHAVNVAARRVGAGCRASDAPNAWVRNSTSSAVYGFSAWRRS